MIRQFLICCIFASCTLGAAQESPSGATTQSGDPERAAIDAMLTQWHKAAADADFEGYFSLMTERATFIGTDASENWGKDAFMEFSEPYFKRGQAWSFTAIERNIYLHPSGEWGWFDEILDTWMKLCRGSGVVIKVDGKWKISHYVLSMTMPNEEVEGAIALKKERDSVFKASLPPRN
ncbi:conserved hypothetical protein [Robiginitalea myxolifaciens]|uniref:SnoaL-like domain-containing protein n=1 Tax=Robiginitalea myxolifaciens TaxID=400055 RepID=A0A1I6FXF8_9FLAO|nr:nuclear transport factor 2 family protein [Robiginitalea myxolifaciens]SFR34642.1 conserved hypothetical protein [Robiginitalea myxolifaciens]